MKKVISSLCVVVRPDGEIVVILRKKEALSYAKHYGGECVRFRWSEADGQYGCGSVLLDPRLKPEACSRKPSDRA